MTRINVVLTLLVVACALGLVTSQHRARKGFIDLERAQAQGRQLEVRWDQLLVEQRQYAKTGLVATKARRELSLGAAHPERTLYLTLRPEQLVQAAAEPAAVEAAARSSTSPARPR